MDRPKWLLQKALMCNISLLLEELLLANYGLAFPEHTQAYRGRLVQRLTREWVELGGGAK